MTDETILAELGGRLAQCRLERIEAGATTQLSTLISILRVLELLDRLESLMPLSESAIWSCC